MSQYGDAFDRTQGGGNSPRSDEAARARSETRDVSFAETSRRPSREGSLSDSLQRISGDVSPSLLAYLPPAQTRIPILDVSTTIARESIRSEMMEFLYRTFLWKHSIGYSDLYKEQSFTTNKTAVVNLLNVASGSAVQELGAGAKGVLGVYCEGLAKILETLTMDKKHKLLNGGTLLRFILIGLHFGPDRAMAALSLNDELWTKFKYKSLDKFYSKILKFSEAMNVTDSPVWVQADANLATMRNVYYEFFRDDDFVPDELEGGYDEKKAEEDIKKEVAEIMRKGRESTVRTVEVPETNLPSGFFKTIIPASTTVTAPVTSTSGGSSKGAQTLVTPTKEGPISSTRVASTPHPQGRRFTDISEVSFEKTVISDPKNPEKMKEGEGEYFPVSKSFRGLPTSAWDTFGPITSEYCEYPEYVFKKDSSSAPTTAARTTMETFQIYGVQPDSKEAGIAIGLSTGVATGIACLTKENKERNRGYVEEIPRPSLKDFREISYFDFNIEGRTADEILGSTFAKTKFISEGARLATKKAILQRVIDDPDTSEATRRIALDQIDKLDVPRMYSQNTYMSALKAAKMMALENPTLEKIPDLVPPPILGRNPMSSSMIKGLFASMGIGQDQKYSVNNPKSKPLKYYLLPLAAKITEERLSETGAYLLLCNILEGSTLEQVQNAMYEEKIPFEKMWIILQKTGSKSTSADAYGKELDQILSRKPEHIEEVLTRIKNIRIRMYASETDTLLRKKLIEKDTLSDFKILIRNFYPTSAPLIEMIYRSKINAQRLEGETHDAFDLNYSAPCPVYTMMETICSVIADDMKLNVNRSRHSHAYGRLEGRARINPVEAEEDASASKTNTTSESQDQKKRKIKKPAKVNVTSAMNPPNGDRQIQQNPQQNQVPYRPNQPNTNQNQNYNQQNQNRQNQNMSDRRGPRSQGAGASYGQRNQNQNTNYQNDSTRCILCNMTNHTADRCYAYPNAIAVDKKCEQCGGLHPGVCKRPQGPSNQYRGGSSGSYGMKQVTDLLVGLAQQCKDLNTRMDSLGNQGNQGVPPAAFLTPTQATP